MPIIKSELRKGAGTNLQPEWDRWAVTNMQGAGAKNDAAAKGWPALSVTKLSASHCKYFVCKPEINDLGL
jgi:hypothetical protein